MNRNLSACAPPGLGMRTSQYFLAAIREMPPRGRLDERNAPCSVVPDHIGEVVAVLRYKLSRYRQALLNYPAIPAELGQVIDGQLRCGFAHANIGTMLFWMSFHLGLRTASPFRHLVQNMSTLLASLAGALGTIKASLTVALVIFFDFFLTFGLVIS